MVFRKMRIALLSAVMILFVLAIFDIWIKEEEMLEAFGEQFLNEEKTEAYAQAHRDIVVKKKQQFLIPGQGITEVSLSNKGGAISVKRSPSSDIIVQYALTVSAGNQQAAERKQEEVKVEGKADGGKLSVVASRDDKALDDDSVTVDYVLLVPDAVKVQVDNESGNTMIRGINGAVDASSTFGLLEIVAVQGNIEVNVTRGALYVSDITGHVQLNSDRSDVDMERVQGSVTLTALTGETYVSRIEGDVSGVIERGNAHLHDIAGAVKLTTKSSTLQLDDVRNAIDVDAENGALKFILAEKEGYQLDVVARAGAIHTQLPLPIKHDANRAGVAVLKGTIGSGAWNVNVQTRASEITIHTR